MHDDNSLQLERFGEYLLKSKVVPENQAPYCVRWVTRFLASPATPGLKLDERLEQFVQSLGTAAGCAPWQQEQARKAVRLYFLNFLQDAAWAAQREPQVRMDAAGTASGADALAAMRGRLRLKRYSYATEHTYLHWVERFLRYLSQTGRETGNGRYVINAGSVRDYLSYLATGEHVGASTQNQAFHALLFLCREILLLNDPQLETGVRAKRGQRLPVVLTEDEVGRLLDALSGTAALMAEVIYGGGLRVMECCRLRVKDLDFENQLLFVRSGKGDKDRSTLFPESSHQAMRAHLQRVRQLHEQDLSAGAGEVWMPDALDRKYPSAPREWGWQYVFPSRTLSTDPRSGKIRRHHVSDAAIQTAVKRAVRSAGIVKPASVHTLRHCFASHMLLSGVDIRQIQEHLGHAHVETTMIYTHVIKDLRHPVESPLDALRRRQRAAKNGQQ